MLYPNVIIAGAPKCATTSVFHYLADHPEVCASSVKETYYLIDKGYPLYKPDCNIDTQGLEGYSQFFTHCKSLRKKIFLEATPDYLYQKTPLKVLPALDPVPNVVFILREPAERIYSMFKFAQNNMAVADSGLGFREFVDAIRNPGSRQIKNTLLPSAIEHSRYVKYLSKWIAVLGKNRVHVLLFEELNENPQVFMLRLAKLLGIEPDFYINYAFVRKNASLSVRSQTIHKLARRMRKLVPQFPGRHLFGKAYGHINAPVGKSEMLRDERDLLGELSNDFHDDNKQLSELLNIDLSIWRR